MATFPTPAWRPLPLLFPSSLRPSSSASSTPITTCIYSANTRHFCPLLRALQALFCCSSHAPSSGACVPTRSQKSCEAETIRLTTALAVPHTHTQERRLWYTYILQKPSSLHFSHSVVQLLEPLGGAHVKRDDRKNHIQVRFSSSTAQSDKIEYADDGGVCRRSASVAPVCNMRMHAYMHAYPESNRTGLHVRPVTLWTLLPFEQEIYGHRDTPRLLLQLLISPYDG